MDSSERSLAVMSLKLVAAQASKLAYDLEHNRLWEGELSQGIQNIDKALSDARGVARSDV